MPPLRSVFVFSHQKKKMAIVPKKQPRQRRQQKKKKKVGVSITTMTIPARNGEGTPSSLSPQLRAHKQTHTKQKSTYQSFSCDTKTPSSSFFSSPFSVFLVVAAVALRRPLFNKEGAGEGEVLPHHHHPDRDGAASSQQEHNTVTDNGECNVREKKTTRRKQITSSQRQGSTCTHGEQ
jgi:hypothetical protein